MTKLERTAGVFFILLSLAVIYYSMTELRLGTLQHPGSGFFPVVCGAGILLLNVIWILKNIKNSVKTELSSWTIEELKGPILAVIIITAYTFLMNLLGYVLSTLVFLTAWEFLVAKEKLLRAALIIVIVTAAMYVTFHYLLMVDLPESEFINNLLNLGGE